MNRHTTIIRDGFNHKFFYLDKREREEMRIRCKEVEDHRLYWTERLESEGIEVKTLLCIQQLKDQGGEWMNVWKINYL